jgi:hypothetical protein
MRRIVSLLAILAAIATVFLALPPAAQVAAAPPGCGCGGYEYTPADSATGATCDEATANLRSLLYGYIYCEDGYGTCGRVLVITRDCYCDGGVLRVEGYVQYRCWACIW